MPKKSLAPLNVQSWFLCVSDSKCFFFLFVYARGWCKPITDSNVLLQTKHSRCSGVGDKEPLLNIPAFRAKIAEKQVSVSSVTSSLKRFWRVVSFNSSNISYTGTKGGYLLHSMGQLSGYCKIRFWFSFCSATLISFLNVLDAESRCQLLFLFVLLPLLLQCVDIVLPVWSMCSKRWGENQFLM